MPPEARVRARRDARHAEVPLKLYPRHRLDLAPADLAFALRACAAPPVLPLEWEGALVCQSVRSAFDLFLSAVALPRGSEVLVTALTIPDMVRILEDHGLVPVAVDLEPGTLAPKPEWILAARTPKTRAALIAHLMGGRMDFGPLADALRGLVVIEDAAQAFTGLQWRGHGDADVSLFSFGSIKTATALGGALAWVRDPSVRDAMARLQAQWPEQPVADYARKVVKTAALSAVRGPTRYAVLAQACAGSGFTLDQLLNQVTRGFPDPSSMLAGIRRRPCGPLVALLRRRLETFTDARVRARAAAGEDLQAALHVPVVGATQPRRTHWLFAITVDDPDALIQSLRAQGFDATRGATSLAAVPGHAPRVRMILEHNVFLPAWPEIPAAERARLADAVNRA